MKNYFIKSPCPVKWDSLQNIDGGKYCEICSKKVYDFSGLSNKAISKVVSSNNKTCARISYTKPDSIIVSSISVLSINTTYQNLIKIVIIILCLNLSISCSDSNIKKNVYFSHQTDSLNYLEGELVCEDTTHKHKSFGKPDKGIYTIADEMPEFPGGSAKLKEFVNSISVYPEQEKKSKVEGKVYIKFVIDSLGNAVKPFVLHSTPKNANFEAEALRIISKMPKWTPGKNDNKPVSVFFLLPINFKLTE